MACDSDARSDKTEDILVRDLFIEAPGGRLFARVWDEDKLFASRPPFILLHDSLGCVELWRDFPEKLAAATGRAVVAYDRLGFGRSDPRGGRLSKNFIREEGDVWLKAVREHFGVARAILFGHSVGGGMAVAAGAAFPGSAEAVVTVAAQAFVEDRVLAGIRATSRAFEAPDQMSRLARYHGDKAGWVFDAWVKTWLDPAFADWTLDADLRCLRCPVLALHGDRDEYGSPLHPQRIASLPEPSGDCVILENCGHIPHREAPEAVIAAVLTFLAARLPAADDGAQ